MHRGWVKVTAIILAVLMAGSGLIGGIYALFFPAYKMIKHHTSNCGAFYLIQYSLNHITALKHLPFQHQHKQNIYFHSVILDIQA